MTNENFIHKISDLITISTDQSKQEIKVTMTLGKPVSDYMTHEEFFARLFEIRSEFGPSKGRRKIIQMDGSKILCDDGSMWLWKRNDHGYYLYVQLDNVPQD